MILLDKNWTLKFCHPETEEAMEIPAQVPGNVLADLHRADLIPDPYFGDHSVKMRAWEFVDWEYQTTFRKVELAAGETVKLRFEGIDTFAEIFLNGERIGMADNMFIAHEFRLPDSLPDENSLLVKIKSPITAARNYPRETSRFAQIYNYESLPVRKAAHSYGWDIAPRLVGSGLWRDIGLKIEKQTEWTELYLYTSRINESGALLVLDWNFQTKVVVLDGFEARLTLRCGDSVVMREFPLRFTTGIMEFLVEEPFLWEIFPYGKPHMYEVELELLFQQQVVDCRSWKIGIRIIELKRTERLYEKNNGEFQFYLNHRPVFIKGSNWIAADALHGENYDRLPRALKLFRESGCNMIRCWGGGVYESDEFFDLCDRMGILVWQDFMFACAMQGQNDDFAERIKLEAEAIVKRLRHHPSLALWCGDNEVDQFCTFARITMHRFNPAKNRITREVLPSVIMNFDPSRDYLPSSPYLPPEMPVCTSSWEKVPENHLWGPRDYYKSKFYINPAALFASEIGYHGMVNFDSLQKFLPESSLQSVKAGLKEVAWLTHSSQPFGDFSGAYAYRNQMMCNQVEKVFGTVPDDLQSFVYASQIVQAEALKFFIENFRSAKGRCTGVIWWNMIDCWPQFSDAVVDYYFGKKLAFEYIRTVQQPLLLACREPDAEGMITPVAINDYPHDVSGEYEVFDGESREIVAQGRYRVEENSLARLERIKCIPGHIYIIKWQDQCQECYNHYQAGTPPFDSEKYLKILADRYPKLKTFLEQRKEDK